MTELRNTQLTQMPGFFAARQTQSASSPRGGSQAAGGFMQSLKQTGAVAADMGQQPKTVSERPANAVHNTENGVKTAGGETTAETSDIREAGQSGTVKVDEKAVKELNDIRESTAAVKTEEAPQETEQAEQISGAEVSEEPGDHPFPEQEAQDALTAAAEESVGKSHLEQAKEALENAMLKAFQELNDPDKKQEEFEEKLLLFLMKLVDSINGKTDKKSPLASDKEDEEEEKLGGALMQIIDNMMENAEKNAELNPDQTAASDVSVIGNYFINLGETIRAEESDLGIGDEPKIREPMKAAQPQLYPELENVFGRGEKIGTNPVVQPVETQTVGEGTKTDAEIPYAVQTENTVENVDKAAETVSANPIHTQETIQTTVSGQNDRAAVTDAGAKTEIDPVLPVTERVAAASESETDFNRYRGNDGSFRGGVDRESAATEGNTFAVRTTVENVETKASKAVTAADGQGAQKGAAEITETENGVDNRISKPLETNRAQNIDTDRPETEAEDDMYRQVAAKVYDDVKRTLKASFAERTGETAAAETAETASTGQTKESGFETEFDELARLFGLKKEEIVPVTEAETEQTKEENNSETPNSGRYSEKAVENEDVTVKESIFGADISIASVKAADVPIPRSLPAENGVGRVVTQIVNQILANLPEKGQETTLMITLNPETLGKISMKLVENAGKISVTITAENKETATILASRAESVQESMRDQGTQLEKYQVVYSAEQDGKAEQQNYEGSSKNPYVRDTEEESEDNGEFEEILLNEA